MLSYLWILNRLFEFHHNLRYILWAPKAFWNYFYGNSFWHFLSTNPLVFFAIPYFILKIYVWLYDSLKWLIRILQKNGRQMPINKFPIYKKKMKTAATTNATLPEISKQIRACTKTQPCWYSILFIYRRTLNVT